ncbi:MarR family winged helix-turn-helix transcriptional regulator [Rhodococcus sp. NPDC058639]|uniref:MarR family winged helix-turn-helix transcriptional regulator n=1 Tax=Rhodococcus sp. NPDC058639 TaxID=3346570 RepID=UPI00365635D8
MSTTETSIPELLSAAALTSFRLNGQFLDLAETLAAPAGLTASRWQVLGAVLTTPLPVAGIAREMGITRQSVQRIADLLVEQGLAEYRPNPAHRRAKLVAATPAGLEAVAQIGPAHATAARRLCDEMGRDDFEEAVSALRRLSAAIERMHGSSADRT